MPNASIKDYTEEVRSEATEETKENTQEDK